ncbi:cbb3-type cytochrome oxidase assembly protein CcoS [Colwellia sp. UCD-KL20]|uniref:cbb3-type cytochrome oxidase assembly protein CcoS n=1 Tax=Colwellia sp. UCD-KL20 TaxID=1917165 RepID=UPI000970277F|nr:cbb3-type cytochrome oxidase assembly protein CcoS [Colwellia sp. UCD-KL20]
MSIIYVLIPIAVLLTAIGLYLFFWAVKTEQFDDLEKQGLSILFDENDEQTANKEKQPESTSEKNKNTTASNQPKDH